MRFIRTTNNIAEFIETSDKTGKIISSMGFQFGEVYYQIKNGKVTFYLNDQENPFRNDIWSLNIPFVMDGVEYADEDSASAHLYAVFNDRFQEQLDQLKEDLAAEEARAQEAEAQLDDKIDDESARAIAAENRLQDQVTELSGAVAVLDNRVTDVENDLSALTDTVNDEITRSVAKDAEHDALISGLTNSLDNEIARALAAESGITANLNSEISRSTEKDAQHDAKISALTVSLDNEINRATTAENSLRSDLNAEIARAQNAEEDLDDKIDAEIARANSEETRIEEKLDNEITRSTAKDASHDTLISGLTTNLQNEINRATSAENSIRNDLNAETSARTNADAAMLERIVAVEVGKADANSVYTKAESDNKYATKDYISGLTDNFFDDVIYDKQSKRINFYNGNRIKAFVDASDFVKDGMVSDVRIANNNLVITFNTDAGKDAISIPLTDIFDPANYYTKSEVDSALSSKADKTDVIAISGDVIALSTKVDTISGDIITIQEEIDDIDLSNYYTKGESDGKYQLKGDYVTSAQMSAYTYDKQTIDDKIAQGGSFDPTQYYNKTATDALLANKADLSSLTSHTANTTVHVTSAEKNTWNNKSDFSGDYNDLANKPTIHTYTAGTGIDITNDVISVTGGSQPVDAYTKAESDAKFATITNFNSHSGNTTMHVTASEKNTWNNKSDFSGNYNDLTNKPTIPSKTSDLTNDSNFATTGDVQTATNDMATKTWVGQQGYLTQHQDISGKQDISGMTAYTKNSAFTAHTANTTVHVTSAEKNAWNAKADASSVYNKTEIDNKLSAKPNVWCGDESEWSAISGSTESGTIYLVY